MRHNSHMAIFKNDEEKSGVYKVVDLTLHLDDASPVVEAKSWSQESVNNIHDLIRENARLIEEEQEDALTR